MFKPHLKFLLAVPARWLVKSLEIFVISFCLVIGMCDQAFGQDFKVSASVRPESLTVGDKFEYVNVINTADGCIIEPAPVSGQIGDATVISDIFKVGNPDSGIAAYACTLAVYKPGEAEIPSFVFNITDSLGNMQSVIGQSRRLTIHSILPADTAGIDIADIREPVRLRGPIWPYLLILLGIILILLLLYIYRGYLRKKSEILVIPPRPPWEIAFEKLDGLKSEADIEFGRLKKYYFELSFIIREYLEGRFESPAVECTTYELEMDDKLRSMDEGYYRKLFELFYRADLAKFAKFLPSIEEAKSDLKFAYDFVSGTIPAAEPEKKREPVLEEAAA
jgi:hypothetical protein